jgi:hypothetical protein
VVDQGRETVDVIGMGMSENDALQTFGIQPGPEELLVGAAGAIEEDKAVLAFEGEEGVVASSAGDGCRAAKDDDSLHDARSLTPRILNMCTLVPDSV